MSSEQIILFDIPSRAPRSCWSLNPWKTRMLLNYKGLDYRVEWLEYPDIRPALEPQLPPNPDPKATPYTIPTIRLPTGEYIMDSATIASRIETLHPSPPIHLDSPILPKLLDATQRMMRALAPVYMARVPRHVLGEASLPYWYRTRAEWVGMSVDEFAEKNPEVGCWEEAEEGVRVVTGLLKEKGGPFFMGDEVSYADFVWGGLLIFCKRMGEEEVYGELLKRSGEGSVHERLLEGLEPWTRRDAD